MGGSASLKPVNCDGEGGPQRKAGTWPDAGGVGAGRANRELSAMTTQWSGGELSRAGAQPLFLGGSQLCLLYFPCHQPPSSSECLHLGVRPAPHLWPTSLPFSLSFSLSLRACEHSVLTSCSSIKYFFAFIIRPCFEGLFVYHFPLSLSSTAVMSSREEESPSMLFPASASTWDSDQLILK